MGFAVFYTEVNLRLCKLMKYKIVDLWDGQGKLRVFLFSRCIPDFCNDQQSFLTWDVGNVFSSVELAKTGACKPVWQTLATSLFYHPDFMDIIEVYKYE